MAETTALSITEKKTPTLRFAEKHPVATRLLVCALYLAAAKVGFALTGFLLDRANAVGVREALVAYRSAFPWLAVLGAAGPVTLLLLRIRLGRDHGPLEGAYDGIVLYGLWFFPALLGNSVVLYGAASAVVLVGIASAWHLCVRGKQRASEALDIVAYRCLSVVSAIAICVTALMGAQIIPISGLSPIPISEDMRTDVEDAWSAAYQIVDRASSRRSTPQWMVLAMQCLVHAEAAHLGMGDSEPRVMLCAGDDLTIARYRPDTNEIWVGSSNAFWGDIYGAHMINALCVETANAFKQQGKAKSAVSTDEAELVEAARRPDSESPDKDYMTIAKAYGQKRTKAYLSQWLPEGEVERLTPSADAKLPLIV